MAVTNLQPTCNQLESGEKANDIKPVTNVTNSNQEIGCKEDIVVKVAMDMQNTAQGNTYEGVGYVGYTPPPVKGRYVALNESGTQRIGEDHARAKLTNAQVEAIRDEYEAGVDGTGPKIGYRLLAKKYGCSKRTIRDIVGYDKRNQWAGRWKHIKS